MASDGAVQAPLPPLTAFGKLLHPANPVVFVDIATAASVGRSQCPPHERGRVFIELFQHVAPRMAQNFQQLCLGASDPNRRGAVGAPPMGLKGTFVYGGVPGREVVAGDVVRGDGRGAPFTIHGSTCKADAVPVPSLSAQLEATPGLVRLLNQGPPQAPEPLVASNFSVMLVPPREMPQSWPASHWRTVVGRVVGREGTQDLQHALSLLDHCAKEVHAAARAAVNNSQGGQSGLVSAPSLTDSLPIIEQCGEM